MSTLDYTPDRCRICGLILLRSNRATMADKLCTTCAERIGILRRDRVAAPATPEPEADTDAEAGDAGLDRLARLAAFIEHYPQADIEDIMAEFSLSDAQTYALLTVLHARLQSNG